MVPLFQGDYFWCCVLAVPYTKLLNPCNGGRWYCTNRNSLAPPRFMHQCITSWDLESRQGDKSSWMTWARLAIAVIKSASSPGVDSAEQARQRGSGRTWRDGRTRAEAARWRDYWVS